MKRGQDGEDEYVGEQDSRELPFSELAAVVLVRSVADRPRCWSCRDGRVVGFDAQSGDNGTTILYNTEKAVKRDVK